jgi:hypothetical protein
MNVVSQIASDDQYHYGFNGQMKTNEWAGVGNHNTALFWEYDTRTGARLNKDPVVHASLSPYSTFARNPIMFSDILGKDTIKAPIGIPSNPQPLPIVEISYKQQMARLASANATGGLLGGDGNLNLMQAASQNIGRNDEMRERADNAEQAGLVWFGVGTSVIGGGAGVYGGIFGIGTELWGTKAMLSFGSQGLINGWREIDYADVAGDAFATPGLNALWSGTVDFKPFADKNEVRVQGIFNSKTTLQFGTDASVGFTFGAIGDQAWKPLTPFLKTTTEKSIIFLSTQSAISVGQQGAGKIISDTQTK